MTNLPPVGEPEPRASVASLVISPTIFDTYARPDLIMPLVLANLLSPELWKLGARVAERAEAMASEDGRGDDASDGNDGNDGGVAAISPLLRAAQRLVDRHFEHLSMPRTGDVFGEIDLDEESRRLGGPQVESAVTRILRGVEIRVREGNLDPGPFNYLQNAISRRRFPAYQYAHFDVVRASRRLAGHRKRAPGGLTSCLDETAIFCALVLTLPEDVVNTVVVLASPEHYTAFGWNDAGEPWWFYGKNHLYNAQEWRAIVHDRHGGDAQAAFDHSLGQVDRIVTIRGSWYLGTGESSLPEERVPPLMGALERFFGILPRQFEAAVARRRAPAAPSEFASIFLELKATASRQDALDRFFAHGDFREHGALSLVAYNYRTLAVTDLRPYLDCSRRSAAIRDLGANLSSIDAAIDVVRAIPGRLSIFEDRERIAMAEETWRFQTGTDRDLALLLHVLLESLPPSVRPRGAVETVFCNDDSFVAFDGVCVSLSTMTRVAIDAIGKELTGGRRLSAPPLTTNR